MLICLITLRVCQAQITSRCLQLRHSAKRGVIILIQIIKLECWMCNGVKLETGKHCNQYFISIRDWQSIHLVLIQVLMHDKPSLSFDCCDVMWVWAKTWGKWSLPSSFSSSGWDTEYHLLLIKCIALWSVNVFTHPLLPSICSFHSYLSM